MTEAVADGRSGRRDWPTLRRLLDDSGSTHARGAVHDALLALQGHVPWYPARMTASSNEAMAPYQAAQAQLADAVHAATRAVVAFVRGLEDADRRALVDPLRGYVREQLNWSDLPLGPSNLPHEVRFARVCAARVAGAGCFTGAAATAAWLARRDLQVWSFHLAPDEQTAAIVEALRDRDPRWLADLARRLAGRLRPDGWRAAGETLWATTAALVRLAGIDPPTTDGFVCGWVLARTVPQPRSRSGHVALPLVDRLRGDPMLDALCPSVFEVDQAGELLAWGIRPAHRLPAWQTWPGALAQLAAEGRLDRAMLLDRCLGRLLRGGRPAALAAFVALHEALDPDLDELAARVRDYGRLLPDAPPAIAELAQRSLRRLDDAGRLDLAALVAASGAVLFRPERKLVRAQLTWVDAAARRRRGRPEEVGELLSAATVAFGQEPADLQERAVSLVRRHVRHASRAARDELLHAGSALPDDLRRRVDDALGRDPGQGPGVAAVAPAPARQGPAGRALPPPIGSPAELAEELAALFHAATAGEPIDWTVDPVALERALAALVAFADADRAGLHEAVAPVLLRYNVCPPGGDVPGRGSWEGWSAWLRSGDSWYWHGAPGTVALVAAAAAMSPTVAVTGVAPARDTWLRQVMSVPGAGRNPQRARPRQAILYRLREIGIGLLDEPVPTLLATPATAAGHVDPAVLLDKLARAEREGWQPWEIDLQLALLRLPRETDPAVLDRAMRLRSPAGQRFAGRLRTGPPPDPTLERVVHTHGRGAWWSPAAAVDRTFVIAAKVAPVVAGLVDDGADAPTDSPGMPPSLVDLLFDLDPPERLVPERWLASTPYEHAARLCWPALLPGHRDLVAAHLLPALSLLPRHHHGRGLGAVLPLLAETDGPVGVGLTLALANGLGARERADCAAAADALVVLAGRGQLDGAALGRELAGLVALGLVPVQRLVEPLRDVARSGAHAGVWAIVAAMLPRLLPPAVDRAPQRLAGLIALGSETAPRAGVRGPIPALAAVAERGGSSRLAAEARRLHRILTAS